MKLALEFQPSLRDSNPSERVPGVETPGYFRVSLRDAEANPHGLLLRVERHPQQTALAFRARNIEIRPRSDPRSDAHRHDPSNCRAVFEQNQRPPTSDLRPLTSDLWGCLTTNCWWKLAESLS